MSSKQQFIDNVVAASEAIEQAQEAVTAAIADRADAIRAALDAGVGATPIAQALGVTRHRIYHMRDQGKQ